MSKLRSVNTHFWNDNYIIDLDPTGKLLFLYLLTNPSTNMLGVYELHLRKISFDTCIDKDIISKIFEQFEEAGKASYIKGYVCLHNFTKHQSYNNNMKVSAIKSFNELPSKIRNSDLSKSLLKGLEPLPKGIEPLTSGSEPIAKYEYEYELERELEDEYELEEEKENYPNADRIGTPPSGQKRYGLDQLTKSELKERADLIYKEYPRKVGRKDAIEKIIRVLKSKEIECKTLFQKVKQYAQAVDGQEKEFIPYPSTWFNQHRFLDDPEEWEAWKKSEYKYISYEKMFGMISSGNYRQEDFEKIPQPNSDKFMWRIKHQR